MRKLYENFHIFHFQKRIVSAETIRGNTVTVFLSELVMPKKEGKKFKSIASCQTFKLGNSWISIFSVVRFDSNEFSYFTYIS
jgi:hypothetical protein